MAILTPKKKTRILSQYQGQNSRITNVEKATVYKDRKDGKVDEVIDESLTYEVFFNVDLKRAVASNVSQVEFRVLSAPTIKKLNIFSTLNTKKNTHVTAALFRGTKDSYNVIQNDQKNKILGRGMVNLRSELNSLKLRSDGIQEIRTEEQIYGRVNKIKIVNSGKLKRQQLSTVRLASHQLPTVNTDLVSGKDYYDTYRSMIDKNMDPASAFYTTQNIESQIPNMHIKKIEEKRSRRMYKRSLIETSRSLFEDVDVSPESSVSSISRDNPEDIAVISEEIHTVRTIRHRFKIFRSTLDSLENFTFAIVVKDPETGLITENFQMVIPHLVNLENYYIPETLPEISILREKPGIGSVSINGMISNIDKNIERINISTRKVSDDSSLVKSKFTKSQEISDIKAIRNQGCFRINKISNISSSELVMARITPTTSAGMKISNFSSDVVAGENFNYVYSSLYATNLSKGIKINYKVRSPKVSGLVVYRRIQNEKSQTPIQFLNFGALKAEEQPTQALFPNVEYSQVARLPGVGSVVDDIAYEGKSSTYRLKLFLDNGGEQFSKQSFTITRTEPLKVVKIELSSPVLVPGSSGRGLSVKFNISYERSSTSTDMILDNLRSLGLENIFRNEVELTKSSLSDIIMFGVERINITTSESEFIGFTGEGEFVDYGAGGERVKYGSDYMYKVTAYLTNPEEVTSNFKISLAKNKNIVKTIKQVRIPHTISLIKNSVMNNVVANTKLITAAATIPSTLELSNQVSTFKTLKLAKSFSPIGLTKGIIKRVEDEPQDYRPDKYSTGDFRSVTMRLSLPEYSIVAPRSTGFTRSNMGSPVLRFTISSQDFTGIQIVDYVLITCRRNGQESICGVCHNDGSGSFVFIDYSNQNYIGSITYFGTIVTIDGKTSKKYKIGSTVLLETDPSVVRS